MGLSGLYECRQDRAGIRHDLSFALKIARQLLQEASERASSSKGQICTSVRGAGVKGFSPAERGRSVAEPLDAGEHRLTLSGPTMPAPVFWTVAWEARVR
jgi:hypothetical protein